MEADFDRYYRRDLGATIWIDRWPPSKIWSHIVGLPEDSAFVRAVGEGHTSVHELLAQIRDAVTVLAHNRRWQGQPRMYPRPGRSKRAVRQIDLSSREDTDKLRRFFA